MSIIQRLFGKKREVIAEPLRADGRTAAPRLVLRERAAREDAALWEAFASGALDDVLFAPLSSLSGLNVAERERASSAYAAAPEGVLLPQ